jgi:hypothetical protein
MPIRDAQRPLVERFAGFALAAVRREYPYHLSLHLATDADLAPPRELSPAFYGAYDWHSAVHGHWTLARAARLLEGGPVAAAAREVLAEHLEPPRLATELRFVSAPGREGFERPYGLAWLLQLALELREWEDRDAARWSAALAPLERHAAAVLARWLPRLPRPVRTGEHAQTAFALGLAHDWARGAGDAALGDLIEARARAYYEDDHDAPVAYEPGGQDFLSPALGEADLMRRVFAPARFASWLGGFLPPLGTPAARAWLMPVESPDPSDGKLSHLDGLNLSRAWMLEGIAAALPAGDPRILPLREAAGRHRVRGLAALDESSYAGAHWLGTFAMYLVTRRGRAASGLAPGDPG